MKLKATYFKKTLHFSFLAKTSRGVLKQKDSWFVKIRDDSASLISGFGEASPLAGLSIETPTIVEQQLDAFCSHILPKHSQSNFQTLAQIHTIIDQHAFSSSVIFALESAFLDLSHGGKKIIFKNSFFKGTPIVINGLIWMGDPYFMWQQIEQKIKEGFSCLKLKIGGLPIDKEIEILKKIRKEFAKHNLVIRLDANGAFSDKHVLDYIKEYLPFDIHSIEQPLQTGSPFYPELCRLSPIAIALDEELIGINEVSQKKALLKKIMPAYLILKPSIHGGFKGCIDWITLATQNQIGWWVTSALESNVGLNSISQFVANFPIKLPQGLGTGMIYQNNFASPLRIVNETLLYDQQQNWELIQGNF